MVGVWQQCPLCPPSSTKHRISFISHQTGSLQSHKSFPWNDLVICSPSLWFALFNEKNSSFLPNKLLFIIIYNRILITKVHKETSHLTEPDHMRPKHKLSPTGTCRGISLSTTWPHTLSYRNTWWPHQQSKPTTLMTSWSITPDHNMSYCCQKILPQHSPGLFS